MTIIGDMALRLCDAPRLRPETRQRIAVHALDALGALIAGAASEEGAILRGDGRAEVERIFGSSVADKAACRAASIRLTEIDDIHLASCITPSSVIVATGLSLAIEFGIDDSDALASALAAGYDAMIPLGTALGGAGIIYRGVWPTCLLAPLGAAAVTSRLLGLDVNRTTHALALSLVQANGKIGTGTSRWLTLGLATRTGIGAALGAASGFDGDPALLEGDDWPASRGALLDRKALAAAAGPSVEELSVKRYCAAKQTIAAIDAFRELLADGVRPEAMTAIRVFVPAVYRRMIEHRDTSGGRMGRITSIAYQLALSAFAPTELDNIVRPNLTHDRRIAALMAMVTVHDDESLAASYPGHWPARVEVDTPRGPSSRLVIAAAGDPDRRLDEVRMREKFVRLAGPIVGVAACKTLGDCLAGLAQPGRIDLSPVSDAMGAAGR